MTTAAINTNRPKSITAVCTIGILGLFGVMAILFSAISNQVNPLLISHLLISSAIGAACFFGMWKMKKWSVYVYTGLFVINQVLAFATGGWSLMTILVPAIIIYVGWKNITKMS